MKREYEYLMLIMKNASVGYENQWLFQPIDLSVNKGQIILIDAPSGAGKSSFLRWIAGLKTKNMINKGQIWLNDKRLDLLPAEHRHIGFLFQSALLFPHLTVAENLGFGIPQKYNKTERSDRISDALSRVGMTGMEKRDPNTLSGGQQARIALLRTLLAEPEALLMDEPFSSLDHDMRDQIIDLVKGEVERLNLPVLMVSHDPRDHSLTTDPIVTLKTD